MLCVEAGAWSPVHLVARMRVVEREGQGLLGGRVRWCVDGKDRCWGGITESGDQSLSLLTLCASFLEKRGSWSRTSAPPLLLSDSLITERSGLEAARPGMCHWLVAIMN